MTLRHLLIVNAALLIATGVLFWLGPMNLLLEGYGFPADHATGARADGSGAGYAPQSLGRLLGVVCFGVGVLLLALHDVGDSRTGRRVAVALCAANAAGALAALTQQISIWESALGWVTVATFLLLALGYGGLSASSWRAPLQRHRPAAQTI